MATKKRIVVIGNGMVGYKFCEKFVSKPGHEDFELVVFGEEIRPAYDRVHLSEYFTTMDADKLTLAPYEWYVDNHIILHLGDPVVEIDRAAKSVTTHSGKTVNYDKIVMATGSAAFVPKIAGVEKDGIFVYRTIEDLDMTIEYAKKCTRGVVIGGGLLGLEAAKAVLDLGLETEVVEFAPRLMPRQLDERGSELLKSKIEDLGVKVHLNKNTLYFEGDERVNGLVFADNTSLETDMVVVSAGIKPRDELAHACGLEIGPRGGIVVNNAMLTTDKDIYAIGECALHKGMIYGLVAPGYEMADVAASHILNSDKSFTGFDMSTKLKLIGIDVASFGDPFICEPNAQTIVFTDTIKGVYKRLNISLDGKTLLGGVLVGEAEAFNMLLQTVKNKTVLPPNPEDMILGSRGGSESEGSGVMGLPDEAIICSCESVSKGVLCKTIDEDGVITLDAIKKCTKAGTGCGGCVPMVKDLISETLKAKGAYVRNILCEHFDYTRQELYDLVKINGVTTYNQALDQFGKGHGCEVCKPAVASILASIYNDLILKQDTIQDSNDRYLANIQKNGTYSVVPRIPGGEITPDKLIAIGRIAKKYNLYTKITGGQRLDMFGAHVGDLPDIWEELIQEGFESGHAYGKALRTVKSCVGTTWCRFGMQDSVSFAIRVEERYRGLRAPHKLKSAVSGC
ncbi:MAG: nitrite reductase large subunit NirB, partial [Cytophagales bacterium]|nr:nitrite reductase large subunit NirB [Cytophagales bacterium]